MKKLLTEVSGSALLSLTPKELEKMARREYQDPPLKKTSGANPRWYIRVRQRVITSGKGIEKKQVRVYLGDCKDVGIREANRIRAEKLKEINGQLYTVSSQVVLNDFFVGSYNRLHIPTLAKGPQGKYRSLLTNHILPRFGKMQLADIGTEEIQEFLLDKREQGLSWWTRNDLRNILSSIFTQAKAWGYWPKQSQNPVEDTKLPREKASREKRLLTDEQVAILLEESPAQVGLVIQLAYITGMRISEILGLRWRSVDLDRGWIEITERQYRGDVSLPKTETSVRGLPLGDLVVEVRQHRLRNTEAPDDGFVFHDGGEPLDDRNLNQHYLRKIAKRHGFYFKGLGWHSFRRGVVTEVQESGASTIEAQKIAGHSRPTTTSLYTQLQKGRKETIIGDRVQRLRKLKKSA